MADNIKKALGGEEEVLREELRKAEERQRKAEEAVRTRKEEIESLKRHPKSTCSWAIYRYLFISFASFLGTLEGFIKKGKYYSNKEWFVLHNIS